MRLQIATLLLCGCAIADDSILVNGTELKIGMSKRDVLKKLTENNQLALIGDAQDSWCVDSKDSEPTCLHTIEFDGDKLLVASNVLGIATGEDSTLMMGSFFGVLEAYFKSGKGTLSFFVQDLESKEHGRVRILSFYLGSKVISFNLQQANSSQPEVKSYVNLQEALYPPKRGRAQ